MNHLRRELAPILSSAWKLIEDEARDALKTYLAARKFADFSGPHGWSHAAVNLGRAEDLAFEHEASGGLTIESRVRKVAPLIELRVPFELSLSELDDVERGASDIELDAVVHAARALARAEDRAVFYGVQAAGITGIASGSSHEPIALGNDFKNLADSVSTAIARLRSLGVDGPYGLALDADAYTAMLQTTGPGGYPILQHLRRFLDGPTIWAPALNGALLFSMRGGDFELVVGEDISVGYRGHSGDRVQLYLEESFTFRLLGPEAAVVLRT